MRAVGTITLPDGRLCVATERGTYESETNAWVSSCEGITVTVHATGEALTDEELNAEMTIDGHGWYLHEWIREHTPWQMEFENEEE
jgi:hypothetical protein